MNLPIVANTATDAIRKAVAYVKEHGVERERYGGTIPAKLGVGAPQNFERLMLEVPFLAIELRNPRARWTNIGNNAFITLAEQEDHMAGRNPGILPKYSKLYREWLGKDGKFPYSYGLRLLQRPKTFTLGEVQDWKVGVPVMHDQIDWAVQHLLKHPNSRKCVLTISDPVIDHDLANPPCNIAAQLDIIDGKLNWTTINRSQDIINGLSENIFMFTMWQEEVLRRLNQSAEFDGTPRYEMGVYRVVSTNAHLYQKHVDMDLSGPEPYHYWSRDAAPKTTLPIGAFEQVDDELFLEEDIPQAIVMLGNITDPWWKAWKAALVSEWAIIQGRPQEALEALRLAAPAPWAAPVAKRLLEKVRKPPVENPPYKVSDQEFVAGLRGIFPKGMWGWIGADMYWSAMGTTYFRDDILERVR